jgi:hypothetical protein
VFDPSFKIIIRKERLILVSRARWNQLFSIPNRVLKRLSADNNIRATGCEDRSRPELSAFLLVRERK